MLILTEKIRRKNQQVFRYINSFNKKYDLEHIFIRPTLKVSGKGKVHIEQLPQLSRHILIHSESFTGKTTILRYLALSVKTINPTLLLRLSSYEGDLIGLIEMEYNISTEEAKALFNDENTMLLLDAFDEVLDEQLQLILIQELREIGLPFIITSRSSAIAKFQFPVDTIVEVEDYSLNSIYELSDRLLGELSNIIRFHTVISSSDEAIKNVVYKYPWLLIFMMENQLEGYLNSDFLINLPIHLLDGVRKKLRIKSLLTLKLMNRRFIRIGHFLYRRLLSSGEERREIDISDFEKEERKILNDLVGIGLINVVNVFDRKRYYFSFPYVGKMFIAFFISSQEESELRKILKDVGYRQEFREIIGLSAAFRGNQGMPLRAYFEPRAYQNTGIGQSANHYELILKAFIMKYLSRGSIEKYAEDILSEYFELLLLDVNFSSKSSKREWLIWKSTRMLKPKMLELLPSVLAKYTRYGDSFIRRAKKGSSFIHETEYERLRLYSQPVDDLIIHAVQQRDIRNINAVLRTSLTFSRDASLKLLSSISKEISLSRDLRRPIAKGDSLDSRLLSDDEAYSWTLPVTLALIYKGVLTETEFKNLFGVLSLCSLAYDYFQYVEKNLRIDFRSEILSAVFLDFMKPEFEDNWRIDSFRVIQHFSKTLALTTSNILVQTRIKSIFQVLNSAGEKAVAEGYYNNWLSSSKIYILIRFLVNFKKLPFIREDVEKCLRLLHEKGLESEENFYNMHDRNIGILVAYLIVLESEFLLDFIKRKEVDLLYLFYSDSFSEKANIKLNLNYINRLKETLVEYRTEDEYRRIASFIEMLYERVYKELTTENERKEESFEDLLVAYKRTIVEKAAKNITHPSSSIQNDINKEMEFYAIQRREETILEKMYKCEEFEFFLMEQEDASWYFHAVKHAIHFDKPLFVNPLNMSEQTVRYTFRI